jgi:hypothetical protein
MSNLALKPRFTVRSILEPNDVLKKFDVELSGEGAPVAGSVFTSSVVLKIPDEDVHFWSPQLQLSVEPNVDGGSILHGQFGPRPSVWTLFVAVYFAVAFLAAIGGIFGYSQLTLGGSGSALWSIPIGIALALIVYFIARFGRFLGTSQMYYLRQYLADTIPE